MHSRFHYSFLAFSVSVLFHIGLWGSITVYKADKKSVSVERIPLQVAIVKQVIVPQPVVKVAPVTELGKESKLTDKAKQKQKKLPMKALPKKTQRATKVVLKPKKSREPARTARLQKIHPVTTSVSRPNTAQSTLAKPPVNPEQSVSHQPHSRQLEAQYSRRVQLKIEQQKKYPRRAKRRDRQGVVKVGFTLSRSGAISSLRIVQSSGVGSLDNATLQAVKRVGRFPVFPAGIRKPTIPYIIPIVYRLN